MNLTLFLALIFLATFLLGRLLEKIRIPWIFSALLLGLIFAVKNPFPDITSSNAFVFIAQLGMYFLLFIIGFEIDIKRIIQKKSFIIKTTLVVIAAEGLIGTLFVHYVFNIDWIISLIVAISFATVGEAVLLPILDEFKLINTKFGQTVIGIGVLDDVIEIACIIGFTAILGSTIGHSKTKIITTIGVLFILFILTYILSKANNKHRKLEFNGIAAFFHFVIFFVLAFIGIGMLAEAAALGAILAGIALKNFTPRKKWETIDSEFRAMAYGFFAPVFFLWVGIETDVRYLIKYPLYVLAVIIIAKATKIAASYVMARKELGPKKSVLLGVSLCVKFSTSIVIIKMLYENNFIPLTLYSVLVGATVLFKFIIPVLIAFLIKKWHISPIRVKVKNGLVHK